MISVPQTETELRPGAGQLHGLYNTYQAERRPQLLHAAPLIADPFTIRRLFPRLS